MTQSQAITVESVVVAGETGDEMIAHKTDGSFSEELKWGTMFREKIIAEEIVKKMWPGATLFRWPNRAHLDFAVVAEGEIVALLEIKARRVDVGAFKETTMKTDKHTAGRWAYKLLDCPAFAVVLFTDALRTQDLFQSPAREAPLTRVDRGVTADHCFYPVDQMEDHPEVFEAVADRLAKIDATICGT